MTILPKRKMDCLHTNLRYFIRAPARAILIQYTLFTLITHLSHFYQLFAIVINISGSIMHNVFTKRRCAIELEQVSRLLGPVYVQV